MLISVDFIQDHLHNEGPTVPIAILCCLLFPIIYRGAAPGIWLEKDPPRSIQNLGRSCIQFFNRCSHPLKRTNLRNEDHQISAKNCIKLVTFYNALNINDQRFIELRCKDGTFWTKCLAMLEKSFESKSKFVKHELGSCCQDKKNKLTAPSFLPPCTIVKTVEPKNTLKKFLVLIVYIASGHPIQDYDPIMILTTSSAPPSQGTYTPEFRTELEGTVSTNILLAIFHDMVEKDDGVFMDETSQAMCAGNEALRLLITASATMDPLGGHRWSKPHSQKDL
ncbi:hypothetical protein Tco_0951269 [Tanacetum coccineum]|uniref:Uncharacterized protein n=1 Tax=Tanacetum coccineum TaxID=301880 RepID=A0ABQ5DZP5_9ASTR